MKLPACFRFLFLFPLRSLLSTLGILFGVAAVIAMLSIGEGAKQEILEQIEQLGMNSIIIKQIPISEDPEAYSQEKKGKGLTLNDVEALRHGVALLKNITPLKVVETTLQNSFLNFIPEILATTQSYGEVKDLKVIEGRFICHLDEIKRNQVCILGYDVAKQLGKEGHIGKIVRINQMEYEVVGILKPTQWKESKNSLVAARNMDKVVFIPLGSESSLIPHYSSAKDQLSEVVIEILKVEDISFATKWVKMILDRRHGSHEDYRFIIPHELLQQANHVQKTFDLVLGSIATISLLVGGIGIMNIMLANVSERTKEIGIKRAVGANRRHILMQFLFETLVLTFIGAILGIFLGISLTLLLSWYSHWKIVVTGGAIFLSLMMSFIVGICSGLYPAYQASKLDPIKALAYH